MELNKSIIKKLQELENNLLKSETRKSSFDLSEILADEFLEFGSSGEIYNKEKVIESLQNEISTEISLSDYKVIELGNNHFLATYKTAKIVNDIKVYSLRSSVWRLKDDNFQIIFHQGTLIKNNK